VYITVYAAVVMQFDNLLSLPPAAKRPPYILAVRRSIDANEVRPHHMSKAMLACSPNRAYYTICVSLKVICVSFKMDCDEILQHKDQKDQLRVENREGNVTCERRC